VEGPRHDDHPCFEVLRVRWPLERVRDRGSIIRRIPLHDNELDRDAMTFGLGGKTVDEKLRARLRPPPWLSFLVVTTTLSRGSEASVLIRPPRERVTSPLASFDGRGEVPLHRSEEAPVPK